MLVLLTSLTFISACQNISATDLCPGWIKPITYSSKDTEQTFREIVAHNIKYEENCGGTDRRMSQIKRTIYEWPSKPPLLSALSTP